MIKSKPQRARETMYTKQGFGQHKDVGTVNGWRAVWGRGLVSLGDDISDNGEDWKKKLSITSF